ncbi:SWI/SNF-related matrix-associated actin-dependent regulator of chromatin subfamily A-like protein 1 [Hypsibius exemplaris]|uniref:SWI/SNF-related matrix-associated actin-dependent regulator of chromatin subfamily A-like protein 1 n=1 Tax=Hypsibius exemplaris TaxID=2072580 RepID=A0A1W0WS96_HYPEX|nr:SWI/SNF-related matrix-associated actin-dependent regulator of chromatin subfamily A-like protein 1 [Hypsibius exemplaris]
MTLTEEDRQRNAANRQAALERLAITKERQRLQSLQQNYQQSLHPTPSPAAVQPVRLTPPLQKVTAKAVLTSQTRCEIQAGFSQQLIDLCKRFRTKSYDPNRRVWSFGLEDYTALELAIRSELKDYVELEGLPKFVLTACARGRSRVGEAGIDLSERLPADLLNALLPYQQEGVKFAVRNSGRILLADDMGLGKTIQSIASAVYFRHDSWPVLCVCPSSMRFEWKEQWLRWVPGLKSHDVSVITTGRQTDSLVAVQIAIITYDLLGSMKKHLIDRFPTIICDECHHLKNYKAVRTKAAVEVCKSAKRLLLLSGTPALSKPSELYPQIELLDKTLFKSFPEFGMRYCNGRKGFRDHMDYSGQSNAEELQLVLQNTIMIRRMKADVAQQLPDKARIVVVLDPGMVQLQSRGLEMSASNYLQTATPTTGASHAEIRSCLLNYYQHTGKAKLPAVIQYVQDMFEDNDTLKVVIFAHHTAVLNEIFEKLGGDDQGMRIDGSTLPETRKFLCDKFQRDENCRFAVLSITACSSGITLTAASVVVFAELYWNPGILAQAEDRLHRIGQKNNVTVKYLIAKDTADDHMWAMLQRKLNFLNQVGLSRDNLGNSTMERQTTIDLEAIMTDGQDEAPPPLSNCQNKRIKLDDDSDEY